MALPILPLSLAGRYYSVIPCPSWLTYANNCHIRATHRVLSRATATVEWLCDAHALDWVRIHGGMSAD